MEEKGDKESHARALREARRNLTELENELANERDEARQEQAELRRQIVLMQKQVCTRLGTFVCVNMCVERIYVSEGVHVSLSG
jgi:hypothetical protein